MSDSAKSRMDRIIRLHEEIDSIKADIREVYAEEKADGGDKTAMGAAISIIRKREKDRTAFDDQEAMVGVYLNAYASPSHTHAREAGQTYAEVKGVERPAQKIEEGLREALAVAKGEAEPARWHGAEPTQEQPVTASQSETADQVREVPTVTSAEPVEPSANEYAGTSSDENPAPIPHSPAVLPGKADKTSEAVVPPASSLVANSKPLNPDCRRAAKGEQCALMHSQASCSACANAAMKERAA